MFTAKYIERGAVRRSLYSYLILVSYDFENTSKIVDLKKIHMIENVIFFFSCFNFHLVYTKIVWKYCLASRLLSFIFWSLKSLSKVENNYEALQEKIANF